MRHNHTKQSLWLLLAAGAAAGIVWALWPRPVEVEIVRAERGALAETVSGDGRTRVKHLYVVASPVDGDLERIALQAGDPIDAAASIARIWPLASRPLDPRSRADARAAAEAARAAVTQAEAVEREASAALAHAESKLEQTRTLAAGGAVAIAESEHQGHETDVRRGALDAARAATGEARAQLGRALAALAADAPRGPAPATIVRAPVSGRIVRVVRESAGPVLVGAPLVEVGDVTRLEVVADLLSSDAARVRAGASARLTGWGGKPLAARVRTIEPGAFTKVSALGLEEQRVHVVLDLVEPPPPELGHDYRVDVAIVVWEGTDVVRVPATALFRDGERWKVFVVDHGRARGVAVEIGASDGSWTVVRSGLAEGAMVIAQPTDVIEDGARAAPRPPTDARARTPAPLADRSAGDRQLHREAVAAQPASCAFRPSIWARCFSQRELTTSAFSETANRAASAAWS